MLFQAMKEQIQGQIKFFMILNLEDFQEKIKIIIVRFYLFSINGYTQTAATLGFLMFMSENLNDDGFFMVKKISNRDCLISIVPLTAVIDAASQANGSTGISFKVNNCQMRRPVRFKFIKPDFTASVSGTDINVTAETKWILVLKLTPIE